MTGDDQESNGNRRSREIATPPRASCPLEEHDDPRKMRDRQKASGKIRERDHRAAERERERRQRRCPDRYTDLSRTKKRAEKGGVEGEDDDEGGRGVAREQYARPPHRMEHAVVNRQQRRVSPALQPLPDRKVSRTHRVPH